MFDRIAGVYDAMNTLMTAGLHHRWRERAVSSLRSAPGSRVIDVATGTGDLAIALARATAPGGEVVGCDFSERMLERPAARRRSCDSRWADALSLPYASDRFDAATVGFGARNFSDLTAASRRWCASCAGGRVVILEITQPTRRAARELLPRLVRPRRAGARADRRRWRRLQLPAELGRALPGPRELAAVMDSCGLRRIRYVLTAGGIIALHVGEVASVIGAAVADPFDAVLELGGEPLREAMAEVEARLREITAIDEHSLATVEAGGKRLRPLLVFVAGIGAQRPRRAVARGGGGRADPLGHARPRRRARRRAAAARTAHRVRGGGPRRRDGDRRPALLECVRRARPQRRDRAAALALVGVGRARARRADAARRRLARRRHGRALPRALRAQDRAPLRGRRASSGRWSAAARRSGRSGTRSASRSSCSTTSSTSPGRRRGPASGAAPTCSTGP